MIDLPSPALIGVIHLPPLPGSPRHFLSMDEILIRALQDARCLKEAGFDAAIVENYGDAPFHPTALPSAAVAAMAIVAHRVCQDVGIQTGVNALRNDSLAALGIAASSGASFIRVNVHAGVAATDQGFIEGRAHETLRYRKQLSARVAILADVHVKHAVPISEPDIARAAADVAYRGLADGLIVTGPATGAEVDLQDLHRVREAVPDRPVFVGSGVRVETVRSLISLGSGVIVGSAVRTGGDPADVLDPERVRAFARASGRG